MQGAWPDNTDPKKRYYLDTDRAPKQLNAAFSINLYGALPGAALEYDVTLYLNLAEVLGARIEQGLYRPGQRLPSVRALSMEHGVSLSTVQQAYRMLEDSGMVSPRPKSGYFVSDHRHLPALPAVSRPAQRPVTSPSGSRYWNWRAALRSQG